VREWHFVPDIVVFDTLNSSVSVSIQRNLTRSTGFKLSYQSLAHVGNDGDKVIVAKVRENFEHDEERLFVLDQHHLKGAVWVSTDLAGCTFCQVLNTRQNGREQVVALEVGVCVQGVVHQVAHIESGCQNGGEGERSKGADDTGELHGGAGKRACWTWLMQGRAGRGDAWEAILGKPIVAVAQIYPF
jgi:hypothetical protein